MHSKAVIASLLFAGTTLAVVPRQKLYGGAAPIGTGGFSLAGPSATGPAVPLLTGAPSGVAAPSGVVAPIGTGTGVSSVFNDCVTSAGQQFTCMSEAATVPTGLSPLNERKRKRATGAPVPTGTGEGEARPCCYEYVVGHFDDDGVPIAPVAHPCFEVGAMGGGPSATYNFPTPTPANPEEEGEDGMSALPYNAEETGSV